MAKASVIEQNLLRVYEILYPEAVECVATALRSRFESGELRGWRDGDEELPRRVLPPSFRIERECEKRYITSPVRALGVLRYSQEVANVESWDWECGRGASLLGAAASAMALDVLRFAREKGWSKPKQGEEPAFNPRTHAHQPKAA